MITYNVEMIMALVVFTFSFVVSFLSMPISKKIAFKVGAVAHPRKRDIHNEPIPRMGGIAIVIGTIFTILLYANIMKDVDIIKILAIIIGSTIIFFVGFLDDIYSFKAKKKILGQSLAALVIIFSGITIDYITWPFSNTGVLDLGYLSIPITFCFILGITNAVNFIDGLDGLAAGVSSIGSLYIMVIAIFIGSNTVVLLTAALAGACVGFLPYNFNPAEIFMGDTGSLFIGFILAVASVIGLFKGYATIVVLVVILGIPIFDTAFAIIRRMLKGKSLIEALSTADRGHLHHRLIDGGFTQKKAVLSLYIIALMLGSSGVLITMRKYYSALIIFFIVSLLIYFIIKKNPHMKETKK